MIIRNRYKVISSNKQQIVMLCIQLLLIPIRRSMFNYQVKHTQKKYKKFSCPFPHNQYDISYQNYLNGF